MKYLLYSLLVLFLIGCKSSDSGGGSDDDGPSGFDRSAMLEHWANDIIIPGYDALKTSNNALDEKVQTFAASPTVANLAEARSAFQTAYKTWQKVSFFEVGPAKNENLRQYMNIYPTNVDGINSLALENDYNLHLTSNASKQGYPALDYLLNGGDDTAIIARYTTDNNADDYKRFLLAISDRIKEKSETVRNEWDTYKTTFIANDGSSASGSVDLIANDYLLYYEKFYRNGKVYIPVGGLSGTSLPEKVEAYYSPELSKELFDTATQALHDFFQGKNYNGSQAGLGFESYLNELGRQDISDNINAQFGKIKEASDALGPNLQSEVVNNRNGVLNLYDKIKANVVYLKSDMLSALNISVAYFDGDGD